MEVLHMGNLSFAAFCEQFDNEEACVQALCEARWPNGFVCPRCDGREAYIIRGRRLPLYDCKSCRHQTSATAGTIMEGSRTPLIKWFRSMFLFASSGGTNAVRLASDIHVTYKTAWLILHKIRHAVTNADKSLPLSGAVRVNTSTYGSKLNPTLGCLPGEHPLLAGASLHPDGHFTYVKMKQAPDCYIAGLSVSKYGGKAFIRQHVDPQSKDIVCITGKYDPNRCRPLLDICKQAYRWLNDTFHGLGAKHLQAYLDDYCFRLNESLQARNAFVRLYHMCATSAVMTYRSIINRGPAFSFRYLPPSVPPGYEDIQLRLLAWNAKYAKAN
ncbi:hypothetical protein BG53_07945 [Paenibacillus darwinianus]|uniref:Transposase zinc-ribbon domain-containing protein n=2 Tax=Paenibacillus darwinianus TaxID=1380763 RepID=A0A9W5W6N3_9BACL|nr:hypothetical protein BG53_07945 [Paenibacillus darwinianus]EXX85644.1 hypothetical protein CH50_09020 [Paenibacillus darwinianus]EXX88856.1 hypothetical protein BG52_00955 [Paenibacillus darwinianus]